MKIKNRAAWIIAFWRWKREIEVDIFALHMLIMSNPLPPKMTKHVFFSCVPTLRTIVSDFYLYLRVNTV